MFRFPALLERSSLYKLLSEPSFKLQTLALGGCIGPDSEVVLRTAFEHQTDLKELSYTALG